MAQLQVDTLLFDFSPNVDAQKYDTSQHYTQLMNATPGFKAVDVVAVQNPAPTTAWLIEGKDYRVITHPPKPSNLGSLAQTMAAKVHDTQAGLVDAAANALDASEKSHAAAANASPVTRIVLHLEPHVGKHTALFPFAFPAAIFQALKPLVSHIDPNVLVLNIANTPAAGVPWTVS